MTELKVYKGLSYLLLLPNAFVAIITLFGILASILNPMMFFGMILFVGVVLYAIFSFIFLQKGIINNKKCSLRLKKNVRTTSLLAGIFTVMCLMNCFTLVFHSTSIDTMVNVFFAESKTNLPPNFTRELLTKAIWASVYFLGIYAALLLLHILMTYKFIKMYVDMFETAK